MTKHFSNFRFGHDGLVAFSIFAITETAKIRTVNFADITHTRNEQETTEIIVDNFYRRALRVVTIVQTRIRRSIGRILLPLLFVRKTALCPDSRVRNGVGEEL